MTFNIQHEIDKLIKREGGYVNHPADRGGPTKYGITQKMLTDWIGREATPAAVEALTRQTARDIYYTNYYIRPNIDDLPELLRPIVLDMAADRYIGKRQAIKLMQNALLCHGYDCGKIDGTIGPKTAAAAKAAVEHLGNGLIKILVRRRVIFYEGLVKADPSQRVFLAGWIARAEAFLPEDTNKVIA